MKKSALFELYGWINNLVTDSSAFHSRIYEIESGQKSESILQLESILNSITLEQLGFSSSNFLENTISCCEITSNPMLAFVLFYMPANTSFPVHDHPNMLGISHFPYGRVRFQSYDIDETILNGFKLQVVDSGESESRATFYVTPNKGNFHAITAIEDVLMLDIFLPNYSADRVCTFFENTGNSVFLPFTPYFNARCIPYEGESFN